MLAFWLSLIVKMATSAALVVGASKIVERSGPFIGAMVATLPVSAGPAYAFLALEHGPAFLARSTLAGLSMTACIGVFIIVYAAMAQRHGMLLSLGAALGLWVTGASLTRLVEWTVPLALGLNFVCYGAAIIIARRWKGGGSIPPAPARLWDLPARAGAVMALVALVIMAGRLLGPEIAGMTAQAPVVLTSLAVILHPRVGGKITAEVLTLGLPGMVGFSIGLATVPVTAEALGSAWSLTLGLVFCVMWNLGLVMLRARGVRTKRALADQNRTP
jgi:hypothetical protein